MDSSDLKSFHAEERSAVSTNGGMITDTEIISGVVNNVWPHVLKAERIAGSTLYRKIFEKANSDDDGTLIAPQYWLDLPTIAGDYVVFFAGDGYDTQADITGSERKYGCAMLKNDVAAGATQFTVIVEDSSLASGTHAIFKDGDTIRLTDKANPLSGTGDEEFQVISGTPSVANDVEVTITIADAGGLTYAYTTADDGRVMSVWEPGDVKCSESGNTVTSTSGTYNYSTYPLLYNNMGTIDDDLVFTFAADGVNFTCTGDKTGLTYGSGDINTNFEPQNPDWSKPYFTLNKDGWGGTWALDETYEVTIKGAYVSRWFLRTVPAGTASTSGNKVVSVTSGEYA